MPEYHFFHARSGSVSSDGLCPGQENCVCYLGSVFTERPEDTSQAFVFLRYCDPSIIAVVTTSLSPSVRPETSDNLDVLSCKLQSIQDIDELTKMVSVDGEH